MKKITVLGGGYSAERKISLNSAKNIYEALIRNGYDVEFIDVMAEIDIEFVKLLKKYDLVMPILHGRGGEDGVLQKFMELENIKYFGSDSTASERAFNKQITKEILIKNGIKVPKGMVINKSNVEVFLDEYQEFVIKPIDEGSSLGMLVALNNDYDRSRVDELLELYVDMLAEELVKGLEITVAILGNKALPPVAIFPPKNENFDLDNKYNGKTLEICPIPENILSTKVQKQAMEITEKVHKIIGARHVSRVDMIVTPENDIYVLEINTMPGFTEQSLYPKSAKAEGMTFDQLVQEFVELASSQV